MSEPAPLYLTPSRRGRIDTHRPLLASLRAGKIELCAAGRGHYPGARLRPSELPGLLSAGYWDALGPQEWGMELHRNEGVEFCLLETGAMRFAVDDEMHPLGPGDLTITRPWQIHRQGDPHITASRLHWITLDLRARRPDQEWRWPSWIVLAPADRAELARRLRQTGRCVWTAGPGVAPAFARIAQAVAQASASARVSGLAVGINELLLAVLELQRADHTRRRPALMSAEHTVELFLKDLRTNPSSLEREWSVAEMAELCGQSATRFCRICRRLANESPAQLLKRARLDRARALLTAFPVRPVTDIAYECGFYSSQHLAAQFRGRFGVTPTDYRRRAASG